MSLPIAAQAETERKDDIDMNRDQGGTVLTGLSIPSLSQPASLRWASLHQSCPLLR